MKQSKTSTWSAVHFKKHGTSISSKLEPTLLSCDTGQWILCFDGCQGKQVNKEGCYKVTKAVYLC